MNFRDVIGPVLVRFEGCPEAMAVNELRNAFIEFCKETYGWQTGVQVMSDAPGVVSTEVNVIDICDARIADKRIGITFMNADAHEVVGDECFDYVMRFADPNQFELEPVPTTPVAIDLLIIAAPLPTAITGPDHIWNEWHEDLQHGAIARLQRSGMAWGNPQMSGLHQGIFDEAVKKARIKYARNRRNHGRRLRVRAV